MKDKFKLDDYRFGENDAAIDNNPELRDYLRIMYDQIKFDNKMVGEFSIYGTYKIKPEMQDYLIKATKSICGGSGDTVYAQAADERFVMNFTIAFDIAGKSQHASLVFEEQEVRIDEENITYKTRLAEITKFEHPDFVNYVYKEWHVFANGTTGLEDDPLLRALFDRIHMYGLLAPTLSKCSLAYVNSMVALLPSCGPVGAAIAAQFNQFVQQMGIKNPNFTKNGLNLKKVLDTLMKKNNFFPKLAEIKEAKPILKDFVQPIKSIDMAKEKGAHLKMKDDLSAGMDKK